MRRTAAVAWFGGHKLTGARPGTAPGPPATAPGGDASGAGEDA